MSYMYNVKRDTSFAGRLSNVSSGGGLGYYMPNTDVNYSLITLFSA